MLNHRAACRRHWSFTSKEVTIPGARYRYVQALVDEQDIRRHLVSADQQRDFEKKFAKFFFRTLTPLSRLACPDLKAALAGLGAVPP
jgi:hypothetical protein